MGSFFTQVSELASEMTKAERRQFKNLLAERLPELVESLAFEAVKQANDQNPQKRARRENSPTQPA
jgi:hypothetical protein